MAMLPRVACGLPLRAEGAAESLAAGEFQHVISDERPFWTSFNDFKRVFPVLMAVGFAAFEDLLRVVSNRPVG